MAIQSNNIVRHEVKPLGVSVSLTEWEHKSKFEVLITLKEYSSRCYSVGEFADMANAEIFYYRVLDALQKEQYTLHIYDNGEVKFQITESNFETRGKP